MSIEKAISLKSSSWRFFMKCTAVTLNQIGRRMIESSAKENRVNRDRLDRFYKSYHNLEYNEYAKKPIAYQKKVFLTKACKWKPGREGNPSPTFKDRFKRSGGTFVFIQELFAGIIQ